MSVKFQILFLDNSFGPWHQLYQEGAFKTWCAFGQDEGQALTYMGNLPRWPVAANMLNRILISRFIYRYWRHLPLFRNKRDIEITLSQRTLFIDIPELWPYISMKTYQAIKFAYESSKFDYLIRANATCYINYSLLKEFLSTVDKKLCYAGPIEKGKDFVSGWGIILSRDSIRILMQNHKKFGCGFFDDESIGKIMSENGVKPISIPFKELFSEDDAAKITVKEANQYPMYRMKSFRNGNRNDYEVMQVLHDRLKDIS